MQHFFFFAVNMHQDLLYCKKAQRDMDLFYVGQNVRITQREKKMYTMYVHVMNRQMCKISSAYSNKSVPAFNLQSAIPNLKRQDQIPARNVKFNHMSQSAKSPGCKLRRPSDFPVKYSVWCIVKKIVKVS